EETYVTHVQIISCRKKSIQSAIQTVYYSSDYRNHPYAIQLFKEANIETKKVPLTHVSVDLHAREKEAYVKMLLHKLKSTVDEDEYYQLKQKGEQLFNT